MLVMLAARLHEARTGEGGGVLLMVALWAPVLLLLMAFVIDIGN